MQLRNGKTTTTTIVQTNNKQQVFNKEDSLELYKDEMWLAENGETVHFKGDSYTVRKVDYEHGFIKILTDYFLVELSHIHHKRLVSVSIVEFNNYPRKEEFDYSAVCAFSWEKLLQILSKNYYLTTYPMKVIRGIDLSANSIILNFVSGEKVYFYHLNSERFFGMKDEAGFHLVEADWNELIYDITYIY